MSISTFDEDGREIYVTIEGDAVDQIAWLHYGRMIGTTELILEANPGLADRGAILPQGITIYLPPPPPVAAPAEIQLWD
jgi:phage tail protein X